MRDPREPNRRTIGPHDSLEVYRLAHALALRVHAVSLRLPKHEMYEEGSQMRRASTSVSSQIVEAHALRSYKAEYVHYLSRADGGAEETSEHLRYVLETGSAESAAAECKDLVVQYRILCRKLDNDIQAVHETHDANRIHGLS